MPPRPRRRRTKPAPPRYVVGIPGEEPVFECRMREDALASARGTANSVLDRATGHYLDPETGERIHHPPRKGKR